MNCLTLFFFLILVNELECQKSMDEVIANVTLLLSKHHNSDCIQIFKPENLTNDRQVWKIWKALASSLNMTTGVYNFQQFINLKMESWCDKPVKMMFEDEDIKKDFAYVTRNIPVTGIIWLHFTTSLIVEYFETAYLPFDIQLIVAVIENINSVIFYELYRINENSSIKVDYFGKWTEQRGLDVLPDLLYSRRNNLEGLVLKTGSIENWPTSYKTNKTWDGFFPRIWKLIEERINCTSIHYESIDGTTGMESTDGNWTGLVGMAIRKEIDVIVSELTMDTSRYRVLDHLHPLLKSRYQIYFQRLGNNLEWTSVFKPFGQGIWTATVVWLLLGTIGISLCYYFSLMYGFEDDIEKVFTPVKSFFFMLQSLCQQGHYIEPRSTACRILFFTSYMVSAVLIPSYSASLISSLTQQTPYRPFDSLDEMVKDGSYRLLVKENTAEHAYFFKSQNQLLKDVYHKLIKPIPKQYEMVDTRQALKTVCHVPRYALFGIESIYNLRMATTIRPECPIISLTRPLTVIYLTMGVAKGNPYTGLINYQLQKLIDTGIVKRTELAVWPVSTLESSIVRTQVQPEEVFQMFAFTGFFMAVSITILIFEKFLYYFQKIRFKNREVKRVQNYNWYYRIDVYI